MKVIQFRMEGSMSSVGPGESRTRRMATARPGHSVRRSREEAYMVVCCYVGVNVYISSTRCVRDLATSHVGGSESTVGQ